MENTVRKRVGCPKNACTFRTKRTPPVVDAERTLNLEQARFLGRATCFRAVSKPYQKPIQNHHWGCPSSEEQIPQVVGKTEKARNGMDGLEGNFTRPRQVRYQAALRPDRGSFLDFKLLLDRPSIPRPHSQPKNVSKLYQNPSLRWLAG
jgi:hypothetical protein